MPLDIRIGIVTSLLISVFFLWLTISSAASGCYSVEVDGKEIAVVSNDEYVQEIIDILVTEKSKEIGKEVEVYNEVTVTKVNPTDEAVIGKEELHSRLSSVLKYKISGAVVRVDDVPLFAFDDVSTAKAFIEKLKEQYDVISGAKISFEEDVRVLEAKVWLDKVVTVAEAIAKVKDSADIPKHTIKEGDTLWDIAQANNISVNKLIKLNPELDPGYLQIGQELRLSDKEPLINVVCVFEEVLEERIEAPVEIRRNDKLAQGKSKIIQEGEEGLKRVTYRVVKRNGVENKRIVLSEEVVKEPVPRIVEKGTRVLVASRNFGGGRLAKPSAGVVTSPFGMRWGRMHTGVDFGAHYGSAVVAAEDGKVIRAGWFGGYGLCIDISHGNGMVTRYAHLSRINVKVGDQVQKRQVIGAVGNTGNSTGPHLHFEVIINGRPQNPMNYL
ncbi:peptidoglycan DD-metalloendopeptidase family protein [Peptococcaceae bacterium]|nr:peptidoglycan DD-metalloendopeptidase family protein [Peptococcaceae bacterium]